MVPSVSIAPVLSLNTDDDDGDGIEDRYDSDVPGEDDLWAMSVSVPTRTKDWESEPYPPFYTAVGGYGILTFDTGSIRVYADSAKTNRMVSGIRLEPNVVYPFYVEAVQPGQAEIKVQVFGLPGSYQHTITVGVPVFGLSVDGDTDLNDTLPDGTPDGVENYLPGYEGSTPVLHTTNPGYHPQKMAVVVTDLPPFVDAVSFEITSTTRWPGYSENGTDARIKGDGRTDDFSFAPDEDLRSTATIPTDGSTTIAAYIYDKDFGGYAEVEATLYDLQGQVLLAVETLPVLKIPVDENSNKIADKWEKQEIGWYNQRTKQWDDYPDGVESNWSKVYGHEHFYDDKRLETWQGKDAEPDDPDGYLGPIASHKAAGDGLTPFEEYRGYVLDGGPNHTGGHTRLSPAKKELLVEVDSMVPSGVIPRSMHDPDHPIDVGYYITGQYTGVGPMWKFASFANGGTLGENSGITMQVYSSSDEDFDPAADILIGTIENITFDVPYDFGDGVGIRFTPGSVTNTDMIGLYLNSEWVDASNGIDVRDVMDGVVSGYGDSRTGAGIDVYYDLSDVPLDNWQYYDARRVPNPRTGGTVAKGLKALQNYMLEHKKPENGDFAYVLFLTFSGPGATSQSFNPDTSALGATGQIVQREIEYLKWKSHPPGQITFGDKLSIVTAHELWHCITNEWDHPPGDQRYIAEGAAGRETVSIMFSDTSLTMIDLTQKRGVELK